MSFGSVFIIDEMHCKILKGMVGYFGPAIGIFSNEMGAIFANKYTTRASLLVRISARNFSVWTVSRPILSQSSQVKTGISCIKIYKQTNDVLHFE